MVPVSTAAVVYAGHRALQVNWQVWLTNFLMGPGRTSRILLLIFLVTNWKSLPLGWTVRFPPSLPQDNLLPNFNNRQVNTLYQQPTGPRVPLLHLPRRPAQP